MTETEQSSEASRSEANADRATDAATRGWRYWVGLGLLVLSLILPVLAAVLLPVFGFPESVNAVVMALSLAGGPDVLLVAAAALMGRENIEHVLGLTGSWLGNVLRWNSVTRARYVAGLWVLTISFFVPTVIALLFEDAVVDADRNPGWGYYVMIASDVAFILAFLAMGAPLWQRIRAIFVWEAEISFPPEADSDSTVRSTDTAEAENLH